MKLAILDDYQNIALSCADWSKVAPYAEITVYNDHLSDIAALVERLHPFDAICVMRERTPLRADLINQLPNLKMIASTGSRNASIDLAVAQEKNIHVTGTEYRSTPTIELTWGLILAATRYIARESDSVRRGNWQTSIGRELRGRTLGVVGLGNVGGEVARLGLAFGMRVIAWSTNLTAEKAASIGATLVTKNELFREADVLSLHLILSERSRGIVGAPELSLMKSTSWLINTSRAQIVDQDALIDALRSLRIEGAAIDVFDTEPLPSDHPFRTLENVLATPHIGYVGEDLYRTFYGDAAREIADWLRQRCPSNSTD